jgi:hypothetical protein
VTMTMTTTDVVLCSSCGGRLARDNTSTVCSPCRRTHIEASAHQGSLIARDSCRIKAAFDSAGLYGVAQHLGCTPEDALDVLLSSQLVPFVSSRRRLLLRRLVGLSDRSHVAAGQVLNISRWTIATYRHQLGIERATALSTSSRA